MGVSTEKLVEAVRSAREASKKRNFVQSFDLAVNLRDIDMSKPENRLNEEVVLPGGRGKQVKVGVIAGDELALAAKEHADLVITKEELQELAKDRKKAKKVAESADFFIAQADLMPLVGRVLGPILGPRGKMPKPVPPNAPLENIIARLRRTVRLRTKDKPVLHVAVGTEDMSDEDVAKNIEAVLTHLERKLDAGMGGIKSIYLKTTMGQSVKVEV
ncbi:MAG: 50S ribosomal protein L1 [Euryarchaeota archaeon]|nr:50S ribosomal protein L1 [Euryarchaeota archaeon]